MKWTASKARPKALGFSFSGFAKEQLESINHSIVEFLVLLKQKKTKMEDILSKTQWTLR
jgi:hypothetical protein